MASKKVRAVCIACGANKEDAWEPCDQCGLNPESDEGSLIKSVYLSVGRYEDEDDRERYATELLEIANRIRKGDVIEYLPTELARLSEQKKFVDSVTGWHLVLYLLRVFLPGILIVVMLFLMAYFLQWVQSQK
jgi:hypothetical protein